MLPSIEIHIAEIQKDTAYLRERIDKKFDEIDKHIEKSHICMNRITSLETMQNITWYLIAVVIIGGIVFGLWLKR